jgi:thiosulfate/3-mercaptopyruvate sulfurtransferase
MKQIIFFLLICFTAFFTSCSEDEKTNSNLINELLSKTNSCEGCHTNFDKLKSVHTPDTTTGGGGCGGETPHIEPYDRVYMGGSGFTEFKNSIHGKLPCTECHNGTDNTGDKKLAHSNNFISHPSTKAEEKCANCHSDVVYKTKNSLHEQGWGQKYAVTTRFGVASFSQLPIKLQEGYNTNCAKCHGTCGDCHIMRPKAAGGGLLKGHNFFAPDSKDNCVACHTSRGGHAFYGIGVGTVPDVHLSKRNFNCISCHKADEVHGDGKFVQRRYQYNKLPKCEDCHSNLTNSNNYHKTHISNLNCNVCHSQDYNNCASCHVGGDGARVPAYMNYKIGLNPISADRPFKYATLRRSLMAPDSWSVYGTNNLSNFSALPTYKYSTPHNILRWTSRTQVNPGKPCYDACHIIKEGNNYRNKGLYLFNSDMQFSWEIDANKNVIVDGKLPANWNINN